MLTLSETDNTKFLDDLLKDIQNIDVLVGIPQEKSSRTGGKVDNAELVFLHTNGVRSKQMRDDMQDHVNQFGYHKAHQMYIHSKGSPLWHVPPRPIIEPAIEDDKEAITELLKKALESALEGKKQDFLAYIEKAGLEGQKASQEWFNNPKNNWAPNSPLTIAKKGSDKPLIDTASLRKSITYVVRKKVD